ncbi:ras-like GTP-binding protein rhoA [Uloborus diversus]|uniref:ras-like GTP-binding protein rhoA n=1 Tax=Uloborus diversus TaxID=327109 RepID=UPI0024093010|nr:ras-like GTP-binding protein rhoA [Uloborus diversus]
MEECSCKIVLVGDSGCGKTSLITRFVSDTFTQVYTPTGFERYTATYSVGGHRIHFTLWDTSGTSTYDTVRPLAYKDASVFLLCFSIGSPDSLDSTIKKWYPEIRQHSQNIPIILCGCQSDLRHDAETMRALAKIKKVPVTAEQALGVSRQIHATTYVESSSHSCSRSVRDAFEISALAALGKLNKNHVLRSATAPPSMTTRGKYKDKESLKEDLQDRTRNCSLM